MYTYHLNYVGQATVDSILSNAMTPWVIAQIRRAEKTQQVAVRIGSGSLDIRREADNVSLCSHSLQLVSRLTVQTSSIFYCVKDQNQPLLVCHLFESSDPHTVDPCVLVELPTFTEDQVEAWFFKIHAVFRRYYINSERDRKGQLLSILPCDVFAEVADYFDFDPPRPGQFMQIVQKILSLYVPSERTRKAQEIEELVRRVSLGKPESAIFFPARTKCGQLLPRTVLPRSPNWVLMFGQLRHSNPSVRTSDPIKLRPFSKKLPEIWFFQSRLMFRIAEVTCEEDKYLDIVILDMMASMKEQSSKMSLRTTTALCPDISPSSSHFFEVLYIGRIKVSHKKVPDSFTDDALEKFKNLEKLRKEGKERKDSAELQPKPITEDPGLQLDPAPKNSVTYGSTEVLKNTSSDPPQPEVRTRRRSGSLGSVLIQQPEPVVRPPEGLITPGINRTMVFHVGRTDLRLISPDRKQILLHKYLKDISSSQQGLKNPSYFSFICRENNSENPSYIAYVFNCQSKDVSDDLIAAIGQAASTQKKSSVLTCEHCPMVWYHSLCAELEGLSEKGMEIALARRLETLPPQELAVVRMKLGGAEIPQGNTKEHIQLVMMLLRAHCESKQARHVHDTPENRHEFLTHYLGSGTIFMKAKRSLTSSFDHLLKRKSSKDEFYQTQSLPPNATLKDMLEPKSISQANSCESTISEECSTPGGSMMNIFMKLGNSPRHPSVDQTAGEVATSKRKETTWRQAIFNNVVTPSKILKDETVREKKDGKFYRELWKKAINQQILLIRMEKENKSLSVRQEEANVKRVKLEYEEIGSVECADVWEATCKESRKFDSSLVLNTMKKGVPKAKRGEVWLFLARHFSSKLPPFNDTNFPNYNVSYEQLLKQLTSHQHAILIDLGRTFPGHEYFRSPLGPGQLALFNILKAYSLVDPEVGYCQGLSFLAAVLLLHMSESEAFYMLKQLMFRRQLRARYLPDMSALQVALYQLSRLLHDKLPDLYAHFDSLDVPPTLYAAPWLLTFFASQFSLGFVSRVLDLVFADSPNVLFKMAIVLLRHHKEELLKCDSFEELMDFLKNKLPDVDTHTMDKLVKEVVACDVTKELCEYGVEYHVLQEEISAPRPEARKIKELEAQNEMLQQQVTGLSHQLQIATSNINRLEASRSSHISQLNKMETQVKTLEVTVATLGQYVSDLGYTHKDVQIPNDVLRILAQINVSQKKKLRPQMSTPDLRIGELDLNGKLTARKLSDEPKLTRKLSDDPKLMESLGLIVEENENPKPNIGRVLSEEEKAAIVARSAYLNMKTPSETDCYIKKAVPILKFTQSSFELGTHSHPLDGEDVPTSFGGTTNLKKIQLTRNSRADTKNELKIVETSRDSVGDKLKMTKNKVTRLFESCNDIFKGEHEKPFGQETQLLIKSQAIPNTRNGFS